MSAQEQNIPQRNVQTAQNLQSAEIEKRENKNKWVPELIDILLRNDFSKPVRNVRISSSHRDIANDLKEKDIISLWTYLRKVDNDDILMRCRWGEDPLDAVERHNLSFSPPRPGDLTATENRWILTTGNREFYFASFWFDRWHWC